MNWHSIIGGIGGLLAMFSVVPYIRDVLTKTTRPNTISFLLWEIILLISVLAQFSAGASWSILFLIGDLIGTGTILVLSLTGYGYRQYGLTEKICFILALLAIVSWQATNQPILAIIFAILADVLAAVPTLVKSFKDPWSESPNMWFLIALGSTLALVSTTIFNAENILFPAYILLINFTIGLTIIVRQGVKVK